MTAVKINSDSENVQFRKPSHMNGVFFIVGPTATGKSEIAADVASELGAEVVSADAFQIYCGLPLLTAKPDAAIRHKVPHHLIDAVPLSAAMNAEKFGRLALDAINQIHSRGKLPLVVGGSGLYVKAFTHGFSPAPPADPQLRSDLNKLDLEELRARLLKLDPNVAVDVDLKNRRRVIRALEIRLLTGKRSAVAAPLPDAPSAGEGKRTDRSVQSRIPAMGVFIFRDREDLYARINHRVEQIFENGVIEEVRTAVGLSETASQMIGLREIRGLLAGRISQSQCIAQIQQATRRYAKRQLTWFRRQTNFEPLNLSLLTHAEAVQWISRRARHAFAPGND